MVRPAILLSALFLACAPKAPAKGSTSSCANDMLAVAYGPGTCQERKVQLEALAERSECQAVFDRAPYLHCAEKDAGHGD